MKREPKPFEEIMRSYEVRNALKLCSVIQTNIIESVDLKDIQQAASIEDVMLIADFENIPDVFSLRVQSSRDNDYIIIDTDPAGGRIVLKATYNISTGLLHTLYCTSNQSPVLSIIFGKSSILINSQTYGYDELEAKLFQFSTTNVDVDTYFLSQRINDGRP